MSAAEAVVLPMPMSPVRATSRPRSISSRTRLRPCSIATSASTTDIAGPFVMLAVPRLTFNARSCGCTGRSASTPRSATTTRAPNLRASTLIAAPPFRKLSTICGVTSFGYALTPSPATPWSAASVKTTRFASGTSRRPVMPASAIERSSSLPRLCAGLVRRA